MRRWYWTAAVVAALTATAAQADYIIIRFNIGSGAPEAGSQPNNNNNGPRGVGPGGVGPPPGMMPGAPGAAGGGSPILGGAGGGGGRPGGGGMPAPGAAGGGAPILGGAGSGGGPPDPRNGPGAIGAGGAGATAPPPDFDSFETVVMAVIELKEPGTYLNEKIPRLTQGQYKTIYGLSSIFNDGAQIQSWHAKVKTPHDRLKEQMKNVKTAGDYLGLALFALQHGLLADCERLIVDAGKQPNPTDKEKKVLEACAKALADLNRPSDGQTTANLWEKKLPEFGVVNSDRGHYAVFFTPKGQPPLEATRRAVMLENHIKAYYLWFALKGYNVPFPTEKLVAVMVSDPNVFKAQMDALQIKTGGDAVFASRDNVAVFSTHRLDEGYITLTKMTQSLWGPQGWNRDELLKGKEITNKKAAIDEAKASGGTVTTFYKDTYPRLQTLALLEKALEDEAELAAVTHEGTRQLAVASGLFSRNVILPEWLSFGFASVLETPKGPFGMKDGKASVAFWPGYGAPSWAYLHQFKRWDKSKDELNRLDLPVEALKRTVTDYYFQKAAKKIDTTKPDNLTKSELEKREKEITRAKEEIVRAKTHAWALNYYLTGKHMDNFLAFCNELKNLPRDLEMDEQTVLLTFAKAFKVANAEGTALDDKKFGDMAEDWFHLIRVTEAPGKDIVLNDPKRSATGGPAGGPGGVGPGGMPNPAAGGGKPGGGADR